MRHLIIGTAGHIDHGKTTLIKALTGRETDRLEEEKQRGISIELGFTYFDLPSGIRAGIVDVPGHEKFIKNMLAGVTGMDIVVLVVSADEGVMAQTREHLEILRFVGIQHGMIALTKADLVDEEWLAIAEEDVREAVSGTFLADAPIFPVSGTTGAGIDALVAAIDDMAQTLPDRAEEALVRYGIDRVFTIQGFGTVVTGTLVAGTLQAGQELMVYPARVRTKVRNLQVHDANVDKAVAGQRIAINLAGLTREDVDRGDVLSLPDALENTQMLDAVLTTVELPFPLENRTRLRLYIGTDEVLCRVALLDREVLESHQKGLVQLRLEEPIAVQPGDPYVVRLYSPMITVGGGVILDAAPQKKKRFDEEALASLRRLGDDDPDTVLQERLRLADAHFPTVQALAARSGVPYADMDAGLKRLAEDGRVHRFETADGVTVLSDAAMTALANRLKEAVTAYHAEYPLRPGISKESLRSGLLGQARRKAGEKILEQLLDESNLIETEGVVALPDYTVTLTSEQEALRQTVMDVADGALVSVSAETVPALADAGYGTELLQHMQRIRELVRLEDGSVLSAERFDAAVETVRKTLEEKGALTVAQVRDLLDTNRKVSLALLSYMDGKKITRREGDTRVLA